MYRTVALAASLAALGLALGMALPQSTLASVIILVAALCCAATVVMSEDAIASTHGLHHAIRFPLRTAISATLESIWSRLSGTVRAVFARSPEPAVLELDEPDEEAETWWGTAPMASWALLADSVPPVPEVLAIAEPESPESAPQPAVPSPVMAAPIRSAHVPAEDGGAGTALVEQVLARTRRRFDAFAKRFRGGSEDTGADLSASV